VIERIAAIYVIEKRIRGLEADQRRAVRQAETKPMMDALKARLEATKDGISRWRERLRKLLHEDGKPAEVGETGQDHGELRHAVRPA
jgi:hypothetical protein